MYDIPFGHELILDIADCDIATFSKESLERYFVMLCDYIKMERESLHFWVYPGEAPKYENCISHLSGISAVQFIKTSNITVHTVNKLRKVYLNIFSCKEFDPDIAEMFTVDYFKGKLTNKNLIVRL